MARVSLQFVREARLSSDLIAWFSAGTFSHVDAVMPDGSLLGAFERAVSGYRSGVQIRRPGYINLAAQVRVDIEVTQDQRDQWEAFLRAQIGKAYDWGAIEGFVTGRYSPKSGQWICSAVQTAGVEVPKIIRQLFLEPSKITPVALLLVLSALPAATITVLK